MTCRTKVDDLYLRRLQAVNSTLANNLQFTASHSRFQQDVLRLQVTVYQTSILEDSQGIQQLRHEYFDELCAQTLKLILLDELVQIRREKLED